MIRAVDLRVMATCDLRLILSTHSENTLKMQGFEPSTFRRPLGFAIVPRKAARFAAARCPRGLVRARAFRLHMREGFCCHRYHRYHRYRRYRRYHQYYSYHRYHRWPRDPVKMRPGSSANPVTQSVCAQGRAQTLSVSQCTMFSNPVSQSVDYVQKAALADF